MPSDTKLTGHGSTIAARARDPLAEAAVVGRLTDPFGYLGPHQDADGQLVIRTFQPGACAVTLIRRDTGEEWARFEPAHAEGLWTVRPGGAERFSYRLKIEWPSGPIEIEDPYRFPPILGELDIHLWREGKWLTPYQHFGAHIGSREGVSGVTFVVWAPNAKRVSVVGGFNGWDGRRHPMRLRHDAGTWEIFIPGLRAGELYKYELLDANWQLLPQRADPFAFQTEPPPGTASVVASPDDYVWKDSGWMHRRGEAHAVDRPMSIYEVHLGSWRRHFEDNRYYSYDEMATELVPYVRDMGFTHVEFMPVNEYPFDGSWGYQPTGLYAPTARFGTPDGFRRLVDAFHRAGIGVIVDFVIGHFPTDPHGLGDFDGTHLYEHADPRQGFHPDWNTLIYNLGRPEVLCFLLGSAIDWGDRYHIDGLRVDAVASMLYLDYSRHAGHWVPNRFGGRENLEAIDALKRLNESFYGTFPNGITIAEESTAWPMVSRPTYADGLGFGYKWNMGWMHDTLSYMSRDPLYRSWHHNELTFGLLYAFSENFILPLSHDEVVHGKGSLIAKMPGDDCQKFANLRAYFGFMFGHPGKKLLFMGGEFAQGREWNHDIGLDWHLVDQPPHAGIQQLVRDLNRVYRAEPSLFQRDTRSDGFEWIDASDAPASVLSFLRRGERADEHIIIVCNFTPVVREGYRLGVPEEGGYRELINTDSEYYGGSNVGNGPWLGTEPIACHGRPYSILLTLPPLGTLVLKYSRA
ncbi:MAG TPA: 1,4-alpha-glucan branching protein GlgB [Alphaproteobacteria bacterium]|nr:1,4-alpha-glucan branching protein GlgB [Alphaproteobacteria bacterium]